ncbi:uncharacterized protein LOC102614744 isoform X2 [Citrus sinensis]|uniref:uncharacterized protein LOC102614744 isoform X2 n=1 Tax=Citrus sinensis TaxID=2711 RepID=UPI0007635D40|nr:uncharacterized protein LOC102614744 isoform X2 [Citrus sinensis]
MEGLTASEVAGFGVGTVLLCATIAAPKLDAFFSASQRSIRLKECNFVFCGELRCLLCYGALLGIVDSADMLLSFVPWVCARSVVMSG